eukprot:CAMPEP_0170531546 /NCGR_PEP_ID=MMETSP0209-20121228/62849_1 /TAXON_ID=665100 ORGANISM="Litonotus pictus, Strain P1" /NCGR_SAMPLE_ID=MMETSP0209 /ASSEMBLY_ACC=CAM_ASM_000301 /LENGTH=287 /DNA_ID=CAMNT_0010826325 /DNA_START=136 /DNA_END=996 /DNA_ORIENTATION=-
MAYSGIEVPSRWKVKQSYSKSLMKIMNNDKDFLEYLMKIEDKDSFYYKYFPHKKLQDQNLTKTKTEKPPEVESISNIATQENSLDTSMRKTHQITLPVLNDQGKKVLTLGNFMQTNPNMDLNKNYFKEAEFNQTAMEGGFKTTRYNNSSFNVNSEVDPDKHRTAQYFNATNYTQQTNQTKQTSVDPMNRSTISFNKYMNRMSKRKEPVREGNLLNIDYNALFKRKINIKNKEMKNMWDEVDHYGPKFAHCNTCFNKNLDFFENINHKDGMNIIRFIKGNKSKSESIE